MSRVLAFSETKTESAPSARPLFHGRSDGDEEHEGDADDDDEEPGCVKVLGLNNHFLELDSG